MAKVKVWSTLIFGKSMYIVSCKKNDTNSKL